VRHPTGHADWTPEVVAAAEHLRSVAKRWDGGVATTGVRRFARDETWSAFVTFASQAYDATLWDGVGARGIISLGDEAESIGLRLIPEQLAEVSLIVDPRRLVPYREWHRLRRIRTASRSTPAHPDEPRVVFVFDEATAYVFRSQGTPRGGWRRSTSSSVSTRAPSPRPDVSSA
jgi:hypothetical protein